MLPLSLLKAAQNHPMLVELKNGETYNGHLVSCDNWMNITLRDVVCTSKDGDKFWSMPEVHVRGYFVKYLRVPDEVAEKVPADADASDAHPGGSSKSGVGGRGGGAHSHRGGGGRGGGPGRGGGGGGGRGRGGASGGRGGGRGGGGAGAAPGGGRGGGRGGGPAGRGGGAAH